MKENSVIDGIGNSNPSYKPLIGQHEIEMPDMVKGWLNTLYDNAITEAYGTIDNEDLWMLGSANNVEAEMHLHNIMELNEYIKVLKNLKEKLK